MREVDGASFRVEALPPARTAVVFTADWCGYCQRFLPMMRRARDTWVVDISDEEDPLWDTLGLEVVPTVVVFEEGRELRRWAGILREEHAREIEETLAA